MSIDTIIITMTITSFVLGLTFLILYSSFGPSSKKLLDPFEENND